MKKFLGAVLLAAFATSAFAETSVKITGVHLCCGKCVTAAEKAVNSVAGVAGTADQDTRSVEVKAPDAAAAQKAADALVAAGFFGTSADPAVKIVDASGVKDGQATSLTIKGAHLCCDKCAKGVTAALENVKGVTGHTAAKGVASFEIKGDFNAKEAVSALEKAGYGGKVAN